MAGRAKKNSGEDRIRSEKDPEWRRWFLEVERLRQKEAEEKRAKPRYSLAEKESGATAIFRRYSEPEAMKETLRRELKKSGIRAIAAMPDLEPLWTRTVGAEVAAETRIHAFKKGVLTVEVSNSTLLQEIRNFHQAAILQDLQQIWPKTAPLTSIRFILGRK